MSKHRDPLDLLQLIVDSDDRQERQALGIEFRELYDLEMKAERRFMLDSVDSVTKILQKHRAARARLIGEKYTDEDREKAVRAVAALRKTNPRMSVSSAAKKVGSTLGIPDRTLTRWVSNPPA